MLSLLSLVQRGQQLIVRAERQSGLSRPFCDELSYMYTFCISEATKLIWELCGGSSARPSAARTRASALSPHLLRNPPQSLRNSPQLSQLLPNSPNFSQILPNAFAVCPNFCYSWPCYSSPRRTRHKSDQVSPCWPKQYATAFYMSVLLLYNAFQLLSMASGSRCARRQV